MAFPAFDHSIFLTHVVLMSAAFLLFYPLGAILILVAPTPSTKLHAPWQIFSLALSVTGVGVGIKLVRITSSPLASAHTIIGLLVVTGLLLFQPVSGWVQHLLAVRNGGKRTAFGFGHRWIGRGLIILGMINGGLGFQFGGDQTSNYRTIPYTAIASCVGGIWLFVIFMDFLKTKGGSERAVGKMERTMNKYDFVGAGGVGGDDEEKTMKRYNDVEGSGRTSGETLTEETGYEDRVIGRGSGDGQGAKRKEGLSV